MAEEAKQCRNCGRTFRSDQDFLDGTSRWRICSRKSLWFNCECGSTMILEPGKYPWYSPEISLSNESSSVFNSLANKEKIPYLPASVMELQQLIENPASSTEEIIAAIKKDPMFATSLLEAANSSKIASGEKIRNLNHALVYVGRSFVKELLMLAAIKCMPLETDRFTQDVYWKQAFITSFLAEKIAKEFNPEIEADEAYLAGCFANIGKLILSFTQPNKADEIFVSTITPPEIRNWRSKEKEHEADSHAILGEIAAVLWGLPDYIRDASAQHHNLDKVLKPTGPDISLLDITAAAVQLTHWFDGNPYQVEEHILKRFLSKAKISDKDLDSKMEEWKNEYDLMLKAS